MPRNRARWLLAGLLTAWAVAPEGAAGQQIPVTGLPVLSGAEDDAVRLGQIRGSAGTVGYLLRSPSILLQAREDSLTTPWRLDVLGPDVTLRWNSDLPHSFNDGSLWAGRGTNVRVLGGARLRTGRITLVVAPEFTWAQNRSFQTIPFPPGAHPSRDPWANAFHPLPESLDLPWRYGDGSVARLAPGQSSLTVSSGAVAFGAATENVWIGPGAWNGLLLSSHAEGVPHLFVRTGRPLETSAGSFEGRWMLGRLSESEYFDDDPTNDHRSLSAMVVTFTPALAEGLTLGLARAVYAPLEDGALGLGASLDFLRGVGRPNQEPWPETPDAWGVAEPLPDVQPGPDQVTSWFFRWVFPATGAEVYGEWARFEQPGGLRDLLEFPEHSRGHTLGFQWARDMGTRTVVRLQGEFTNLEPSGTFRHRTVASSYGSRTVPQGYTHRGQVLGAAIGPGASSQWLSGDWIREDVRAGAWVGRIRWDAAARFTSAVAVPSREDVSLTWGLRGGKDLWGWAVRAEVGTGVRINYLFQTFAPDLLGRAEGVDIANTTVSVSFSKGISR